MICLIIPENLGYLVLFLLVRKSVHNFHGTSVLTSHQLTHGFLLKSSWNPLLIGPKALIVSWFHQFLQISFEFLQDYHKKKVSPILRVLPHKKKTNWGRSRLLFEADIRILKEFQGVHHLGIGCLGCLGCLEPGSVKIHPRIHPLIYVCIYIYLYI
jgi:hypothetical protein